MVDRGYYEVALLQYYSHSFASAVIDLLPAQTVETGTGTASTSRKKHC
jgi:hypothetical protein